MTELKVNFNRLWQDLEELARIGQDPRGGISRPSFSLPDLEARDWLKGKIEASGLALRQDSAGNIFGRLPRIGDLRIPPRSGALGLVRRTLRTI